MKTIDVTDIANIIDNAPKEMSLMFIGDTGIGKTQVIKQYAKENDIYLKTLILSQLEASETLGIPVQSKREFNGKEYSTIETAIPEWVFELAEHENAMLYLDEFLCAEPSVMNSFLNFITEKGVGGIDLSHVKIVSATNIGNYTYEPDNNILSRFCMFYVENSSYSKYLKTKYKKNRIIFNDYKDEEERDSIIFEPRSLKPRCQEMLCLVTEDSMRDVYYEGYTNRPLMPVFHNNEKINSVVKTFAQKTEDTEGRDCGYWHIPEDDIDTLAGMIYKKMYKSRKKNVVEYCSTFKDLIYNRSLLEARLDILFTNKS